MAKNNAMNQKASAEKEGTNQSFKARAQPAASKGKK